MLYELPKKKGSCKMIEISNLVKKYGKNYAVNDISFEIQKGEIVGFGFEVQGAELSYITLQKGDKKAIEFKVEGPGANISFVGVEEENGGKVSGDYALKANSMELIKIKTSDVDMNNKCLTISRAYTGRGHFSEGKSENASRTIVLGSTVPIP